MRAGKSGCSRYSPLRNIDSARLSPSALTLIWTSPFSGGGTSSCSIFRTSGPPDGVRLVAYLCVGYPVEFRPRPMLEEVGGKGRLRLDGLVFQDRWGVPAALFEPPSG